MWLPDAAAQAAHATLKISNIQFDGDNATNEELGYAGLVTILIENASAPNHVYANLGNNTFKNTTGTGIYVRGMCYGVAYSNLFDRIANPVRNMGKDYTSWSNEPQDYGLEQNFYFEDNIIQFSSSWPAGNAGWLETGQGGRIVVRYNTWNETNAAAPGEFYDTHGLQNAYPNTPSYTGQCEAYSTMVAEYYGNRIFNQANAYRWMYHRGGWLLMFYNTLAGNTSPNNQITQYYCNSCQKTGSFNQKADNTYAWRNLANGTEKPFIVILASPGCVSDPVVENADFFNYNAGFNGTSGMGCGPLSARPATCTTGVGYWATNQSCTNLSGMVGSNPSTPISGTLYKCTSTNTWTAYYTPYQYPHPLRSGSAVPATTTSTTITPVTAVTVPDTVTPSTSLIVKRTAPGQLKKISR